MCLKWVDITVFHITYDHLVTFQFLHTCCPLPPHVAGPMRGTMTGLHVTESSTVRLTLLVHGLTGAVSLCPPIQFTHQVVPERRRGRLKMNWYQDIQPDLQGVSMSWNDTRMLTADCWPVQLESGDTGCLSLLMTQWFILTRKPSNDTSIKYD